MEKNEAGQKPGLEETQQEQPLSPPSTMEENEYDGVSTLFMAPDGASPKVSRGSPATTPSSTLNTPPSISINPGPPSNMPQPQSQLPGIQLITQEQARATVEANLQELTDNLPRFVINSPGNDNNRTGEANAHTDEERRRAAQSDPTTLHPEEQDTNNGTPAQPMDTAPADANQQPPTENPPMIVIIPPGSNNNCKDNENTPMDEDLKETAQPDSVTPDMRHSQGISQHANNLPMEITGTDQQQCAKPAVMENSRQETSIVQPIPPHTTQGHKTRPQPILTSTLKNVVQRHELDLALNAVSVARLKQLQDAMTNKRASTSPRASTTKQSLGQAKEAQQATISTQTLQHTDSGAAHPSIQAKGETRQTSLSPNASKNPPPDPEKGKSELSPKTMDDVLEKLDTLKVVTGVGQAATPGIHPAGNNPTPPPILPGPNPNALITTHQTPCLIPQNPVGGDKQNQVPREPADLLNYPATSTPLAEEQMAIGSPAVQADFTHNPPASPTLPTINEENMETGADDVFPMNVSDQLEHLGMDPLDLNETT